MKNRYYNIIYKYFKDKRTSKGVPYMNHIDEGIEILKELEANNKTIEAYTLHPFIQCVNLKGADGKIIMTQEEMEKYLNIYEIDSEVIAKLFLYRKFANSYLCRIETDGILFCKARQLVEDLKNYPDVIKMLIADKVQNYRDFLIYRKNNHKRSNELDYYFNMWLNVLGSLTKDSIDKKILNKYKNDLREIR